MAEPAIQEQGQVPDNVVSLPGVGPAEPVNRKIKLGLSFNFAFDIPKVPSVSALRSWSHQEMINCALLVAVVLLAGFAIYTTAFPASAAAPGHEESATGLLRPNVLTEFNPSVDSPKIEPGAYIDKLASVIGDVSVGTRVYVAPFASIRGDEEQPIVIREGTNVIGATVAEGRYVPSGSVVVTQEAADALPKITPTYTFAKLNDGVLAVNEAFADKYLELATGVKGGGSSESAAPSGH